MIAALHDAWAITPEAFRALVDQSKEPQALMARDAIPLDDTRNASMRGDVGILHVKGPLFRYANWLTSMAGTSSYGQLRKDLQALLDKPEVKAILWVIDSPGGEVNGCQEMADAIYAARSVKPMCAYVSGTGASAAYFLTSAVGMVYCAPTAIMGSIGVITCVYDDTKALADAGLKEFEIVSSQSPKKSQQPGDSAYRARIQQRLDDLADVFIGKVAQYRGITPAAVIKNYGQGDALVGARAYDAGLVDGITDVESVIAGLQAQVSKAAAVAGPYTTPQGAKMEVKALASMVGLGEVASDKQIEDRAKALQQFERDVLAATGAKDVDAAIGSIKAGTEAIGAAKALKDQLRAQEGDASRKEFRRAVKSAIKAKALTLGEAATIIPTLMKEEEGEKAKSALAAMPNQDRKSVLDALCSASIGAGALKRVQAFLKAKESVALPSAASEPAPTSQNRAAVAAETASALESESVKRIIANPILGMSAEELAKYGSITDENQLKKLHAVK